MTEEKNLKNEQFAQWWESEGSLIDPDSAAVDWFYKRRDLCAEAWEAARLRYSHNPALMAVSPKVRMHLARNIVNQLFDEAEVSVAKRQAINDKCDEFVDRILEPVTQMDRAKEVGNCTGKASLRPARTERGGIVSEKLIPLICALALALQNTYFLVTTRQPWMRAFYVLVVLLLVLSAGLLGARL